jgi:hypothetical protein
VSTAKVQVGKKGVVPSRTALVVSADAEVRADWAHYFERIGMRTLRCVGPQIACALLDGDSCPLHAEADLAIYERAALTPELTLKLMRASRWLPIAFARDQRDGAGHHEPLVTGTMSGGRNNACIGLPSDQLGR